MNKSNFLLTIKQIISIILQELPYFGFKVCLAKINVVLQNNSLKSIRYKNQIVLDYLMNHFQNLVYQYKFPIKADFEKDDPCSPIWIFWWQGLEQMPEIIKACYCNTLKMAGDRKVILIDQNNIKEYVDFPEYVWAQFEEGMIRIQHLADMLRIRLLRQYGGLWLDASRYCLKPISEEIFKGDFYSVRSNPDIRFISEGRWTTFLIGGRKSYILFDFLDDFFMEYCKTGKPFIDYFMFDTAIALAYDELYEVKKDIDNLSVSEKGFYWLTEHLEDNYYDVAEEMAKQSSFQKIGWSGCIGKEYSDRSVYDFIVSK